MLWSIEGGGKDGSKRVRGDNEPASELTQYDSGEVKGSGEGWSKRVR